MSVIIKTEDLFVNYGKTNILNNISIQINKNSITSIIGPSGCGKTTLLQSFNRIVEEFGGNIIKGYINLYSENIMSLPKEQLRRKIGLVFQTPKVFPLSIYKNIIYGPVYHELYKKKELPSLVKNWLEDVSLYDEIKGDFHKSAYTLSGGQQQRLCLARAIASRPDILLLDEPCSALDINNTKIIEDLLLRLKHKYTIIIVTHNLAQAKRISDDVLFMLDGKLIESGSAEQIFNNPKNDITKQYFGGIFG